MTHQPISKHSNTVLRGTVCVTRQPIRLVCVRWTVLSNTSRNQHKPSDKSTKLPLSLPQSHSPVGLVHGPPSPRPNPGITPPPHSTPPPWGPLASPLEPAATSSDRDRQRAREPGQQPDLRRGSTGWEAARSTTGSVRFG